MPDDAGQSGDGAADQKGGEKTYTKKEVDDMIASVKKGVESDLNKKFAERIETLEATVAEKSQEADEKKSDAEKLAEQLEKLQSGLEEEKTAREKAELKSLRAEVASAKEVPAAFVDRLTGTTREELEEDADSILEAIGGGEETEERKPGVVRQPKSTLKGGSNSSTDDDADVQKVFDSIDPT